MAGWQDLDPAISILRSCNSAILQFHRGGVADRSGRDDDGGVRQWHCRTLVRHHDAGTLTAERAASAFERCDDQRHLDRLQHSRRPHSPGLATDLRE